MPDQTEPPDLEVNIPIPEGLKVTTEDNPYHILLVSDLAGSDSGTLCGALSDGVVGVTADSLGELMQTARPSLRYKTSDPLASGNVMVEVELTFDSLRAFEPGAVAGQLPATAALLTVRERIVERLRGKLTSDALARSVADAVAADGALTWLKESLAWAPKRVEADASAVDDVLGQLDLGDESSGAPDAPPPKTPVGRLVTAAADGGTSIPAEEASTLRHTLGEIDRRVSIWLTAVLHSPQAQSMEAAWRSLAYLVSQIEFRKGLRLSLLHAPAAQLPERFRTLLIDPVFDDGADAPDLIVVDRRFGNSATDMEMLDELAQHAASLPAVLLGGVSPQFFGLKYAWQMTTLPAITNVLDQWQFAKWKTLRGQRYARSLGLVFGRCLVREPYKRMEGSDLDFAFSERCITDQDFIWANGPVAVACSVASSVAENGWPTAVSGYVHGRVEGFKTATGGKKGDKTFGPSDTKLSQSKIEELGMAGLNAVVGVADHNDVLVWNGMTPAQVRRDDVNALLEVSLPYQLFAARLSTLLLALKPHLSGMSPDKVAAFVRQHIRDWLPFDGEPTPEQVSVQVRPPEKEPGALEMAVTVAPPPSLLPGAVPVVMGYRLG
jgi:type VI secretion system protein ImpC